MNQLTEPQAHLLKTPIVPTNTGSTTWITTSRQRGQVPILFTMQVNSKLVDTLRFLTSSCRWFLKIGRISNQKELIQLQLLHRKGYWHRPLVWKFPPGLTLTSSQLTNASVKRARVLRRLTEIPINFWRPFWSEKGKFHSLVAVVQPSKHIVLLDMATKRWLTRHKYFLFTAQYPTFTKTRCAGTGVSQPKKVEN